MLLVFTINSGLTVGFTRNTTDVRAYFDNKFPYILNYRVIDIGDNRLIVAHKYNGSGAKAVPRCSTDMETFNNVLESIGGVNYNENQNRPQNIKTSGGNCQAYTLLLDAMCKKVKLKSSILYTDNHMYNRIQLDGKSYTVDLTKNEMKLEE